MLPKINCIIIDDEPKAIDILQERLSILYPDIEIYGTYTEWKKALEVLRTVKIDIVFTDISMPEKSGIDILRLLQSITFQLIFITAHSEYALDAIKFSAVGYVLKPIDDYELSFAVNKAIERIRGNLSNNNLPAKYSQNNIMKIGIPNVKGIDYLNANEILYFESVNKYTKVVTKNYSLMSSYNLGEFKKIIDSQLFFQVHRSYIVNMYHIKRYETSGFLIMEDNMQIPVSKNIRTNFVNVFSNISRTAGFKAKEGEN